MNKILLLTLFLFSIVYKTEAQTISFGYDTAGNQTTRTLCLQCQSKKGNTKEIIALTEEDMQKFYPEDIISYYPNPVKEELYLKWELIDNNYVSSIKVYDLNGRMIDSYDNLYSTNNQNVFFQKFPKGIYIVILIYSNKEEKSIKIIKE
jgi:hypothetical protein